jgi:hypothetical protein
MAERRIFIQIGQSNATAVGDLKSWNDQNPFVAIGSQNTNHAAVPQYAQGTTEERHRMSSTFAGGPTLDWLGAETVGQHQEVNIRGRAISGIRFYTPYNPTPSLVTYNTRATCYPGRAEISLLPSLEKPLSWRFQTNHTSQGAQHIEEVVSISTTTFTTNNPNSLADDDLICFSLIPGGDTMPPEIDNKQVYRVEARTLTTFQVRPWPQVEYDATVPLLSIATTKNINCQLCTLGTITRRRTQTTHLAAHGTPGSLNDGLFLSVYPSFSGPHPVVGEQFDFPITLGDSSAVPGWTTSTNGPMCFRSRFGGLSDAGEGPVSNCSLRAPFYASGTAQDRPLRITCPGMAANVGTPVAFGAVSGLTRQVAGFSLSFSTTFVATGGVADLAVTDGLAVDDLVEFETSGVAPTGLPEGNYYVVAVGSGTVQLSATEGGLAITPSDAGSGTHTLNKHDANVLVAAGSLQLQIDDRVTFTGAGVPAGLLVGDYFVISLTATTVQFAAIRGGPAILWPHDLSPITIDVELPTDGTTTVAPATTYYVSRHAQAEAGVNEKVIVSINTTANYLGLNDHTFVLNERVRLTGDDLPAELTSGLDYFVRNMTEDTIQIAATHGGPILTLSAAVATTCTLERVEDAYSFYISAAAGGPEVVINANDVDTMTGHFRRRERFEGSLTGLQARCISGTAANIGSSVDLSHIELLNDSSQDISVVHHDGAWPSPPADGEGRAMGTTTTTASFWQPQVTPANQIGQTGVIFNLGGLQAGDGIKFYTRDIGGILPHRVDPGKTYYCVQSNQTAGYFSETYDGEHFHAPFIAATGVASDQITFASAHELPADYPVAFQGDNLPSEITAGTTYYAIVVSATVIQISATPTAYGGTAKTLTAPSGTLDMDMFFPGTSTDVYTRGVVHEGRDNPYPPGFNYPNQQILPKVYQPFLGNTVQGSDGATSAMTVGMRMHDYFGEPVYVLNLAFGGTSLGHKEVIPGLIEDGSITGTADTVGLGWMDLKQQISWSESDPSGCYAAFLKMLDGLKKALQREGNTGKVELVLWNQGEDDSIYEELANSYQRNLRRFKQTVRADLKARGFWPGDESKIPWVQPLPLESYSTYSSTVIAAIKAEHESDPYARWFEAGDGLEQLAELYPLLEDAIHYTGRGLNELGNRAFAAYESIVRTGRDEVNICNLALANIGDSARLVSLTDTSRQAELCRQYFDLARDGMLEMHRWEWATRRKALVATTKLDSVTQWDHAYRLPDDWIDTISILPENAPDDYFEGGVRQPVEYHIEQDWQGDRILYTNVENAHIRYTSRIVDTTKFSATFVKALSWYLASMLAGPLIKGDEGSKQAQIAENRAFRAFGAASKHDARAKRKQDRPIGSYPWRR